MARKKIILTDNQKEILLELVSKKLSGVCIAKKIGVSQSSLWRIMESLGLNKKKNKSNKKQKKRAVKYFSWNNFKNKTI